MGLSGSLLTPSHQRLTSEPRCFPGAVQHDYTNESSDNLFSSVPFPKPPTLSQNALVSVATLQHRPHKQKKNGE